MTVNDMLAFFHEQSVREGTPRFDRQTSATITAHFRAPPVRHDDAITQSSDDEYRYQEGERRVASQAAKRDDVVAW